MPLGFERLNARKSQPNNHINFIKPLKGRDEAVAQDFLERIAAQCLPVMREHHIYVMALEEFPPNREFVGRNFNAGEVIQLVLKSHSGRWLPFNYVQMVMMHELAHCKQMNHSKAFWAVRNKYAEEMRGLWSKKYTGEGLWGRGISLKTSEFERNTVLSDDPLPEHLCGGTYRSRGRKRKSKPQLSYQERKERRILKKFGANGVALGEDDEIKTELEGGKKPKGKPRVAGSKRGRELRAAAALARFDQQKKSEDEIKKELKEEDSDSGSELESDTELDGPSIVDESGRRLVKICEDEDPADDDAQNEMRELLSASQIKRERSESPLGIKDEIVEKPESTPKLGLKAGSSGKIKEEARTSKTTPRSNDLPIKTEETEPDEVPGTCLICSFQNPSDATTCNMCSHVLVPNKVASWSCQSMACRGSRYLNASDTGVCGVCGERKGSA
ncbi:WLM-domain-containing protein [Xylariaceae sp. FL0255]|nr:WLM-domain-containing protein [Xylariaceae sp. FL0255]